LVFHFRILTINGLLGAIRPRWFCRLIDGLKIALIDKKRWGAGLCVSAPLFSFGGYPLRLGCFLL